MGLALALGKLLELNLVYFVLTQKGAVPVLGRLRQEKYEF